MSNPTAAGGCRAARRPPPLLLQWVGPPPSADRNFGILRLALGREANCYFLKPLPSDFGRAFALTKLVRASEGVTYHVLLDGPRHSSCDCLGFTAHGHCKHMASVRLLLESGQLPGVRGDSPPTQKGGA